MKFDRNVITAYKLTVLNDAVKYVAFFYLSMEVKLASENSFSFGKTKTAIRHMSV
jgi:hypothetical protein